MTQIFHPEWRDEQEPSFYPFADTASLTNAAGSFFTEGTFLDAAFYPIGGQARLYISQVVVTGASCTLQLGDETTPNLATASIVYEDLPLPDPADPVDDPEVIIAFEDQYGRPAGLIVSTSARINIFQSWASGTHAFRLGDTELAASVCMPTPEIGFRGFILEDGSVFTGDIWLVGEDGIALSYDTETKTNDEGTPEVFPVIRVDVVGDPLFRRRLCASESGEFFRTPRFIQSITVKNGCDNFVFGPDSFGDFKVTVGSTDASDTILRIRAIPGGIIVEAVGERLEDVRG